MGFGGFGEIVEGNGFCFGDGVESFNFDEGVGSN